MDISAFTPHALGFISEYRYLLIIIGTIFEGPILMVACGFLWKLGSLNFWPAYLSLIAGDLIADVTWYYVGHYFATPFLKKFGHFFGLTEENLNRASLLFQKYHERVLFLSKITIGFGLAIGVLIFAGMSKVPFKKYISINALGELVLVALLMWLGNAYGQVYANISQGFKIFYVVGIVLLTLFLIRWVTTYAKKKTHEL